MHHLLDLQHYDSNNSISAMTVMITRREALAKKLIFRFLVLWIFMQIHFESFSPKHLIENLPGPLAWTSIFISLTDSCSPQ